jgi:hypothetical protein
MRALIAGNALATCPLLPTARATLGDIRAKTGAPKQ